jgi:hypothetical protein
MRPRTIRALIAIAAFAAITSGVAALASPAAKLPKCASVKCRELGCPADVLCVSGSQVKTCADVCNGH